MHSTLRWRIAVTLGVTFLVSIWAWYPVLAGVIGLPAPEFVRARRLALGLDLRGGVVHIGDRSGPAAINGDQHIAGFETGSASG